MAKQGFYHISDSEIVYLARRSKLEPSKFKLVRVRLDTFAQGNKFKSSVDICENQKSHQFFITNFHEFKPK